jgi:hypothetical protein
MGNYCTYLHGEWLGRGPLLLCPPLAPQQGRRPSKLCHVRGASPTFPRFPTFPAFPAFPPRPQGSTVNSQQPTTNSQRPTAESQQSPPNLSALGGWTHIPSRGHRHGHTGIHMRQIPTLCQSQPHVAFQRFPRSTREFFQFFHTAVMTHHS